MKDISAQEAYERMRADPSVVYLDVRSTPEFKAGRPLGAISVPLMERGILGRMAPNPLFLDQVKQKISSDREVICGCQMGGRSQRACELMQRIGYTDLSNIRGGFGGSPDQPGWSQLGLPVSADAGPGVGYESLLEKAKK